MHVYMQTCRVKIRNIRGQRTPEERFIADISSREKANGEMHSRVVEFSGDAFVTRRYCVLFIFFFYRWNEFLESSNSERSFRIHIRRGYKRDSRKGTGWNWLERKFVLISCWMIVICFFEKWKGCTRNIENFCFFFFLNKERDEF